MGGVTLGTFLMPESFSGASIEAANQTPKFPRLTFAAYRHRDVRREHPGSRKPIITGVTSVYESFADDGHHSDSLTD